MATSPVEWHQPTHRDNAAATGDGSGEARDSVVRSDKTEGQRSTAEEQEDELSRPREAGKEGNEPPNSAPHVIDLTEDE
ncbi:hypothetical protein CSUI_004555 [Cystoisospora suis]|uniref:Uncharacterized protein n=1 Tax=Cystoisospora suis TaxID=483139 RepID=A0A2C6L164_9APIC|nr:hypothetical protein CSUI_004555 [Cystoisospora suis]